MRAWTMTNMHAPLASGRDLATMARAIYQPIKKAQGLR